MDRKWFKTLSIEELSTWVKHFDNSNSMLNKLSLTADFVDIIYKYEKANKIFPNHPSVGDIREAKRILKDKKNLKN